MIQMRIASLLVLGALLSSACSSESSTSAADAGTDSGMEPDGGAVVPTCNGHEELCERRFDEVAFPMTHNAMSNAEAGWSIPNQNFGIAR